MISKHGIQSNKTEGSEARDVRLNGTSLRPYDFGSESDSESVSEIEYESNPNNNVNEGFNSQHPDITDGFIWPITSLTQYPPAQLMDRHGDHEFFQTPGRDLYGTPESSLNSSPTGSTGSGESLFSLQMNGSSFTSSFAEGNKFHGHEELSVAVSEGLSPANHPITHQTDFVLPLNFPRTNENNTNEKKKKKNGACLSCLCCSWPSCSLKCLNCSCWKSCSPKCSSCSGCCNYPSWRSCCCKLPSCNSKCFTWTSCHCKCLSWSCC